MIFATKAIGSIRIWLVFILKKSFGNKFTVFDRFETVDTDAIHSQSGEEIMPFRFGPMELIIVLGAAADWEQGHCGSREHPPSYIIEMEIIEVMGLVSVMGIIMAMGVAKVMELVAIILVQIFGVTDIEIVIQLGKFLLQYSNMSVTSFMLDLGGKIYVPLAIYSLRISFCTVPARIFGSTPCFLAVAI